MSTKVSRYGQALDELEALHQAGKISDVRYELHRQRLLAEASRPKRPLSVSFLIWFGVAAALLIALRVLGALL